MTFDAIATEPQFLSHLAPVWRALEEKGRFLVDAALVEQASRLGIEAEPIDAATLRRSIRVPAATEPSGAKCLVASYGDVKVARRLGYGDMAFLEHGCAQSYLNRHPSYSGGMDRNDHSLFLVPNEYAADLWRKAYPGRRVEVVGSTRVRELPAREPDGQFTIGLSFHWPASFHPFAGTALGDYLDVLKPLALRYHVIGHGHPKGDWQQRVKRRFDRAGIEFVSDFDEVCRRADLYIADNTSTLFEFAATGRPVVLLNARHWTRDRQPVGLRFWDAAHVGPNVDPARRPEETAERLFAAIEQARRDGPNTDALAFVFAGYDGAVKAAAAVMDWAGVREAVAA